VESKPPELVKLRVTLRLDVRPDGGAVVVASRGESISNRGVGDEPDRRGRPFVDERSRVGQTKGDRDPGGLDFRGGQDV